MGIIKVLLVIILLYRLVCSRKPYIPGKSPKTTKPPLTTPSTTKTSANQLWTESIAFGMESSREFIMSKCPGSFDYCKKLPYTMPKRMGTSCCEPCDCSDECVVNGNCCEVKYERIKKNGSQIKSYGKRCINPNIIGHMPPALRKTMSYVMVSTCDSIDKSIEEKLCLSPNISLVEHLLPVYSTLKKLNYRNIFCAACNHETDFLIQWIPHLTCESYDQSSAITFNANDVSDILHNVMKSQQCTLEWKPPTADYKTCFRAEELEANCTIQLGSPVKTDAVKRLCHERYAPFGYDGHFYRNIFCFGCIVGGKSVNSQSCLLPSTDPCLHSFEAKISDLLTMTERQTDVPISRRYTTQASNPPICEEGLTYNSALLTCLKLACPPGSSQIGSNCVQTLEVMKGIGLEFRFGYIFDFKKGVPSIEHILSYSFLFVNNDLSDFFIRKEAFKGSSSGDNVSFHVHITKYATQMTNITEEYNNFKVKVNEHEDEFADKIWFDNSGYKPLQLNSTIYASYNSKNVVDCLYPIAMSEIQFCQTVQIEMNNNNSIQYGALLVRNTILFQPSEFIVRKSGNESLYAQVCLETYVQKMLEENVASSHGPSLCVVLVSVTVMQGLLYVTKLRG